MGNIVSKVTGLGTTTYGYDDIYQLTSADHPIQSDESFTYDGVGNRLTSIDYSDWSYNSRNQLTGYNGVTYGYDDNGNTTSKTDTGSTTTYTYNYENRLTRIDFPGGGYVTYKYDVKGRRIEKNVDVTVTKYLYDGDVLLAEYNGSDVLQRNYFYGAGDINPSILYEGSTIYFYHYDHLNTSQKVTNESGTVVWDATYKSFGETTITTETVTNNFRFPGQYYDTESGLHYNYHRYYDTNTGRYLREDPIEFLGGDIRKYVYVGNNPSMYFDFQGLSKCENKCLWAGSESGGWQVINSDIRTYLRAVQIKCFYQTWQRELLQREHQDKWFCLEFIEYCDSCIFVGTFWEYGEKQKETKWTDWELINSFSRNPIAVYRAGPWLRYKCPAAGPNFSGSNVILP